MTNPSKRTGIVQHPRYADHCVNSGHPECSDRLTVLYDMLEEPGMRGHFKSIIPRKAEEEELLKVHSQKYVRCLESTQGVDCTYLDEDTQTSPHSYEASLLAAEHRAAVRLEPDRRAVPHLHARRPREGLYRG